MIEKVLFWVAFALIILVMAKVTVCKYKKSGAKSLVFYAYGAGVLFFGMILLGKYNNLVSVLFAFIYAAQMFTLGVNPADMDVLTEHIKEPYLYGVLFIFWILFVGCPVITATFIAELIKDTVQKLVLKHVKNKTVYLFSEKNENSLAMSEGILTNNKGAVIIFANTEPSKTKEPYLCLNMPMEKVFETVYKRNSVRLYFINSDEGANLDKFQQFDDSPYTAEEYMKNAVINVFTESEVIEEVLDPVKKRLNASQEGETDKKSATPSMLVINPRIRFVHQLLWEYPLYEKRAKKDELNVTVIGVGLFGGCFAANAIWCGQMPGSRFKLTLVDVDKEEKVLGRVFEKTTKNLFETKSGIPFENKILRTDIEADNFIENAWPSIKDSDYIMISTRDDDLNIKIADELRVYFGRNGKKPYILAYAKNDSKYRNLRAVLLKKEIYLVGGLANTYKEGDFFNERLYRGASIVYKAYKNNENTTEREFFAQQQKHIYSSYASAIHARYKRSYLEEVTPKDVSIQQVLDEQMTVLARCEHDRWIAFEVMQGSVPVEGDVRKFVEENFRADRLPQRNDDLHIHGCIRPFDELKELSAIIKAITGIEKNFQTNDFKVSERTLKICDAIEK